MFLSFLTPKIDPAFEMDSEGLSFRVSFLIISFLDEEGPALPRSNNEEFRPFMRRLPEFKFW
jgi:hypothetical protein